MGMNRFIGALVCASIGMVAHADPFTYQGQLNDEGQPAGIISDRDILRETSPFLETPSENRRDVSTLNKVAHQIMTRKLISVKKTTKVREAIDILLQNKISCLPVLDPLKNLEGIVTWRDLIKAAIKLEAPKGWNG